MSSDSKLLLGLIVGATAGAVAGLLLAPASGKETRETISEKANELKGDLDKKFNDLSQKIKDLDGDSLAEFKEKFNEVKASVKERYDKVAEKVKDLETDLSAKIETLKKEGKKVGAEANSI